MISVIVPVYNVEPYLCQCLDSILTQTYQNIEIILINDGSTDASPKICDKYGKRDRRIIVFHTENHGLSAARNLGIKNAHGEWIMFVDSDDWVEPGFCELPYNAAVEKRADLVIFERALLDADGNETGKKYHLSGMISERTAVECGRPAVWNKLYRKQLFRTIRYPEGRLFEDVATTHRVIHEAGRIVALDETLYNYRFRSEGLSRQKEERKYRELFISHLQRYEDLCSYGYPREHISRVLLCYALKYLVHVEPNDDPLYHKAEELASSWQGDPDEFEARERNALTIWRMNKTVFHLYYRNRGCKVAKTM